MARAEEIHNHSNFEIGLMIGPAFTIQEGVSASVHGHAIWYVPDTPVGMGIGYERLLDKHEHNTVSFVSQLHIIYGWSVILAPGFTFNEEGEASASFHFETVYEFEIREHLHVGPVFELALDRNDAHITPGLHAGVSF